MLLTDLAVKVGRLWSWWTVWCWHWWLIIVTGSECVKIHFPACCKQAEIQTLSQEAVKHFCMDLSSQEEKARQQCKKIASGLCARKNILFLLVEQVCMLCVFLWSVEYKIFWQRFSDINNFSLLAKTNLIFTSFGDGSWSHLTAWCWCSMQEETKRTFFPLLLKGFYCIFIQIVFCSFFFFFSLKKSSSLVTKKYYILLKENFIDMVVINTIVLFMDTLWIQCVQLISVENENLAQRRLSS